MQIERGQRLAIHMVLAGMGPHHAERGLSALPHHVAELAGHLELPLPGHAGRFDEEDVAAHRGPGETGHDARRTGPQGQLRLVLDRAKVVGQVVLADDRRVLLAGGDLRRDASADAADLPLQVANARFGGVGLNNGLQGLVGEAKPPRLQAAFAQASRHQVSPGDLQLLQARVAGQVDDLHTVPQRRRHGVHVVGGADEHHARQIEWNAKIVVLEGAVLFGIEHFEQCRGRVASKIGTDLVHFVDHEHGVVVAGLANLLDNPPGQGPDVGAPMAADVRLVAHAADGHADELAPDGPGDGLPEGGLADARRTREAQDRHTAGGVELAHG